VSIMTTKPNLTRRRMRTVTLFLLTILCGGFNLSAQVLTSAEGNWTSPTTWVGGTVPTDNSDNVFVRHNVVIDNNIVINGGSYYMGWDGSSTTGTNATDEAGGAAYTLTMKKSGGYTSTDCILDVKSGITTFGGAASLDNANLIVRSGATLVVGGLTISNNSKIIIEAGGTLIVNGNMVDANNGSGSTQVQGYVYINGNYSATTGSVEITGSGSFETTGTITTNGNSTVFGSSNDCTTGPCSGAALSCGSGGVSYANSISPSTQTICSGQTPASLGATTTAPTPTYQWQVSASGPGSGYIDIAGATSSTYAPGALTSSSWYRVVVTTSSCTSTSPSAAIEVSGELPTQADAGANRSACFGSAATLSANSPTVGNGAWSITDGPDNSVSQFSNVSDPAASFQANASGTYLLRWSISNSCGTSTSETSVLVVPAATIIWNGSAGDQQWSNPVNWSCPQVPTAEYAVEIPEGSSVLVDVNASVKSLIVAEGATLTLGNGIPLTVNGDFVNEGVFNGGSGGVLQVSGNVVNAAVFNAQEGTVVLNGSTLQEIDAANAVFYKIDVNKTGGNVRLTSPLRLANLLDVISATIVESDGNLEILSIDNTTANDGSIGALLNGAGVTGSVKVNRHMKNGGKINRYISFPVQGVTAAQISDDFALNSKTIRYYNEPTAGHKAYGYVYWNLSGTLQTGRGYLAYMWKEADIQLDVTGTINSGSIALPVTYTSTSGGFDSDGWNLVGNPYPSAIKWDLSPASGAFTFAHIEGTINVPDLSTTSEYPNYFWAYNAEDGSGDLPDGVVAMGQAFWVHATDPGTSLTIHERAKVRSENGRFYRSGSSKKSTSEQLKITIRNGKRADNAFFKTNPLASDDYDRFDASKMMNPEMNVYLLDDFGRSLLMHTVREIPRTLNIRIGVEVAEPGTFFLSLSNQENFLTGDGLVLIDRYLGKVIPMSEVQDYSFTIRVAGQVNDRFFLTRNPEEIKTAENTLIVYPNPVKDLLHLRSADRKSAEAEVMDNQGRVIGRYSWFDEGTIDMSSLRPGMYILKVRTSSGIEIHKIAKD
jgi:hypothetical protein